MVNKNEKSLKFKILNMEVSEKLDWQMKIKALYGLKEARPFYTIEIRVDEQYYADIIRKMENEIKKAEEQPDMFEDWKVTVQSIKDNIELAKNEMEKMREMEIPEFVSQVLQADFTKDTLLLQIPEERIQDTIKIRKITERFVIGMK